MNDERLELPPVRIYSGRWARWLTKIFGILAITFAGRIFIAPRIVQRDSAGRRTVPASLMAHEARHVVQYAQIGFMRFLISYLFEYARGLRLQKGIGKAARQAAYYSIKYEREAYDTEHAYAAWRSRRARGLSTIPDP